MRQALLYVVLAFLAMIAIVGLVVGLLLGPLLYGIVRGYEVVAEFMDRHSES